MSKITIYGTEITLPEPPEIVEDWGTSDPKEQYWRRREMPEFFEKVEFDKDGNALLDERQTEYAKEEVRRCRDGFWFMSNGVKTYITGKTYFYLQWWKLEDDIYPDYRDTIRRSFLHLDYWEKVLWCLGRLRGKKRREGASSEGSSNIIYECIFYRNSFCGHVSKSERDGKITFTNMIAFGYRQLPVFLKPKQLNNKDSVTELVFAHKSVDVRGTKGNAIDNDTGHRSRVDYRSPGKNAYDSGRLSRGLFDEGGKWELDVPFSVFISIVSKTLVKGAKRVGFMECPSTVNEMTKGGGAQYKLVWDSADQSKGRTPNRLVRYFTPAYDGFEGFIDKYGMSVIDEPTEEQYQYLVSKYVGSTELTEEDIRLGARQYLKNRRLELEGEKLEEEIRMNPFDEREMFNSSIIGCLYNSFKLNEQASWLEYNSGVIERGNLVWENNDEWVKEIKHGNGDIEIKCGRLIWVANENGKYEKVKEWLPNEPNNVFERNGFFYPNGNYAIRIGCDPFKYDKTKDKRKSTCVADAYQMPDPLNDNYVFSDTFVMRYADRPPTTDLANEAVLKMAWFCGCQVLFERNVGDHPKKFFMQKKCGNFLMWLPDEVEFGIYTDGQGKTTQAICNFTESYIEKDIQKVFFKEMISQESGWLGFEVDNTQPYDDAMASGFALIASKQKRYTNSNSNRKDVEDILPLYKVK